MLTYVSTEIRNREPIAAARLVNGPARELLGLHVAHRLALAAVEGRSLSAAAAARQTAAGHPDLATAALVEAVALAAYKAHRAKLTVGDSAVTRRRSSQVTGGNKGVTR
jgi:hypothetical protein